LIFERVQVKCKVVASRKINSKYSPAFSVLRIRPSDGSHAVEEKGGVEENTLGKISQLSHCHLMEEYRKNCPQYYMFIDTVSLFTVCTAIFE
jgi:hypothetical protein